MAVSINQGLVATDDPLQDDIVVQMRRQVAMLDVNTSKFFTMLDRLNTRNAKGFKHEWLEDQYLPTNLSLSVSITTTTDDISITSGEYSYLKVGDLIRVVQTGETMRIVSIPRTDGISVQRSWGAVDAASAQSGTSLGGLLLLSGSNEEGGEAPTAIVTKLTTNYNYTGIIRNAVYYTGTEQWIEHYSGPQLTRNRMKVAIDHKRQIENTLWFGAREYVTGTVGPRHTSGGIMEYLANGSSNQTSINGDLDKKELQDFLRGALQYGSERKVFFCAPLVAQVFGQLMDDDWVQAPPNTKVYGVNVNTLISAAWAGQTVPVVVKGEWNRFGTGASTANKTLGAMGVMVDMENVELLTAGSDAQGSRYISLRKERQAPSADSAMEEYLSEFTLAVYTPDSHAAIYGVTGAA